MEVEDLLSPRAVIAQLRASNKKQVLLEIARRAAAATGVPSAASTMCSPSASASRAPA